MKLKEIIEFLESKVPKSLTLISDEVGFKTEYDLNQEITSIKIYMDFIFDDDINYDNTLIITHHPPLFIPRTPTYTLHSNWDIIEGGANDALADILKLDVIDYFDSNTKIGRICNANRKFGQLKEDILDNFSDVKIVNNLDDNKEIRKVGIVSGFGLKNSKYIQYSKHKNLDVLISGDLTQETAILAKNLKVTIIDLSHHDSEVPGLYALRELLKELDVDIEIIDKKPFEKLEIR